MKNSKQYHEDMLQWSVVEFSGDHNEILLIEIYTSVETNVMTLLITYGLKEQYSM